MANRKRKNRRRESQKIARRSLQFDTLGKLADGWKPKKNQIDDRRAYHPDGFLRPLVGDLIPRSPLVHKTPSKGPTARLGKVRLGFREPQNMLICQRRSERREVIFAKRKNGSGGAKPKFKWHSQISCKRRK